jgi:ribosomal protein L37E
MKKCKDCGFPEKIGRYFDWRSDGTITSTDRARARSRVAILDVEEFERLFSDLSGSLGISIDRLLIQAQKSIGKELYANLPVKHVKGLPASRLFRPVFLAKLMARVVAGNTAALGGGTFRLERYRPGRELVVRFINPVVVPRVVGNTLGIYESVEDMRGSHVEYEFEGPDLMIRMSHGDEEPELETERRLYLEESRPAEGPLAYERCGRCGVPLDMARMLEWHIKEGSIINRHTGRRELIIAVQSMNAILRELESELGEDLTSLIYEHQKAFTLERLDGSSPGELDEFWDKYLKEMGMRGLGYPKSFRRRDRSVSVGIANSYNVDLYAAKVAAAFEKTTALPSRIKWGEREHELADYTISAS